MIYSTQTLIYHYFSFARKNSNHIQLYCTLLKRKMKGKSTKSKHLFQNMKVGILNTKGLYMVNRSPNFWKLQFYFLVVIMSVKKKNQGFLWLWILLACFSLVSIFCSSCFTIILPILTTFPIDPFINGCQLFSKYQISLINLLFKLIIQNNLYSYNG